MISNFKVLAIIPARAGSKRLKNKNILLLNNKPLISYSIIDAQKAKYIDKIVVSTDSKKIASIAKAYGVEAPFLRPEKISGDRISDYPVIAHAVRWLEERQMFYPDIIVFLRPTIPIRAKGLSDRCIEKLVKNEADSVRTVRSVGRFHPYWMLKLDRDNFAKPFIRGKTIDRYYQKQLLPELYEHDGYCDVIRRKNIDINCSYKRTLKGLYGRKVATVINNNNFLVNIDTLEEFKMAEFIISKKGHK